MKVKAGMVLAGLVGLAGCTNEPMTGVGLYMEYCASCHGADARGTALVMGDTVPGDLTRLSAKNGGVFPAAYAMSTIDGYARDATHGPMPTFGDLIDSEIETWTDDNGVPTPTPVSLILLAEYLEGLQEE